MIKIIYTRFRSGSNLKSSLTLPRAKYLSLFYSTLPLSDCVQGRCVGYSSSLWPCPHPQKQKAQMKLLTTVFLQ